MDGTVLEKKSSFKMRGLSFSCKLDWGPEIVFIAKSESKKTRTLIRSTKFFSPKISLYLYKSTIQLCLEYCCHVWAHASSCYLDMLDKLQKGICRTAGSTLAASAEHFHHPRNVAYLSLLYRHYFGRCLSDLVELVPFLFSCRRNTYYSERLHDFSASISR